MLKIKTALVLPVLFFFSLSAQASEGWSFNLGYNNPPGATLGVNFMRLWTHFAFELGIGWLNLNSADRDNSDSGKSSSSTLALAGDANLKYLFGNGGLRPYLQGGFGVGSAATVGHRSGADVGVGEGFFGAGLFVMGQSVYGYGSVNLAGDSYSFFQAGIGFHF